MKKLTVQEFMDNLVSVLMGVVRDGDIVCVETEGTGSFVVMEEPEYQILKQSLEMLIAMNAAGLVPQEFLDKYAELLEK